MMVEGWACAQHGVLQRLRAQGMVQGIGRTGEQQTRRIGQEGRRRGAITAQVTLTALMAFSQLPRAQ